jgi:phosphate:Na+ symporter
VILTLVGGIGIFLVGMILLSEGLKAAAGGALRSILQRFARSPARAVLSGAGVTALVQSSSATTLTTIGFVSAGLLTFPQAVGLIFGANLGTTSTGWLVAVLGFKVNVGAVALPVVGVGAILRLLGKGRWAHGGLALAGFGLIFVGIDTLQDGMADLADRIDPASLPGATWLGRVVLVLVGAAMTVVMQSSSAAVATTLTALHAGGLDLDQAALLVIGQNLGTSVKAVLAAIGGSVPVRRTAAAHTLFNLITAVLALLAFPILLGAARVIAGEGDPAVAIALFHSGFNILGVAVLFPVLNRFAAMVERMVPETRPDLTRNLDPTVAEIPEVAVEAAGQSVAGVAHLLVGELARLSLESAGAPPPRGAASRRIHEVPLALGVIRTFLAQVRTPPHDGVSFQRHLSLIHAVDHLDRLEDLRREFEELGPLPAPLAPTARRLADALTEWTHDRDTDALGRSSRVLAEERKARREAALEEMAVGGMPPEMGRISILHVKRMDRIAYHAWRASHHMDLARAGEARGAAATGGGSSEPGGGAPGQETARAAATGDTEAEAPSPLSST